MSEIIPAKQYFSNRTYDFLKFLAMIVLPACGTLYFALSQIWGLPFGEEIVGSITAVDVFLGSVLSISKNAYDKSTPVDGNLNVDEENNGGNPAELALELPLEELMNKDKITVSVNRK